MTDEAGVGGEGGPSSSNRWRRLPGVVVDGVVDREWLRVLLVVTTVTLSAFSVYWATLESKAADDLRDDARIEEALTAQATSYFRALVHHDLTVVNDYCGAVVERDAALARVFSDTDGLGGSDNLDAVVAGDLTTRSLQRLLLADPSATPCGATGPGDTRVGGTAAADAAQAGDATDAAQEGEATDYSLDRAQQWRVANDPERGGLVRLNRGAAAGQARDDLVGSERRLMAVALGFAAALLFLTVVELADGDGRRGLRRVRVWATLVSLVLIAGGALFLPIEVPYPYRLFWAAAAVALLAAAPPWFMRKAERRQRVFDSAPGRDPSLWAELIGAGALVAFAGAALGLSVVTANARDTSAAAAQQHSTAERLLEAGEQSALRDLTVVAELAEFDAREAAFNQQHRADGDNGSERIRAARAKTKLQLRSLEEAVGPALDEIDEGGCPQPRVHSAATPVRLLSDSVEDPYVFSRHVQAHGEAAAACEILASITRDGAARWSIRASILTVALIVIGLAGYMLALAADRNRAKSTAIWLLGVGAAGSAVGALIAVFVLFHVFYIGAEPLELHERKDFASDVAAAEKELARGECPDAIERLDGAIDDFDGYAPAFRLRAYALFCAGARPYAYGAFTSAVEPWVVGPIVEDLRRANELSPDDALTLADLGWAELLDGIVGNGGERALAESERFSARAVEILEERAEASDTAAPLVHILRFNLALAQLAAGQDEASAAYTDAVECLAPEADCPGSGVDDVDLRHRFVLLALADLELVDDGSSEVEAARTSVVSSVARTSVVSSVAPGMEGDADWTAESLKVSPQKLEVIGDGEYPTESSVVWYHRPSEYDPWSVLLEPSLETLPSGEHLGDPIPTVYLLEEGEFRADVYVGEARIDSLTEMGGVSAGSQRKVVADIGMAAVIPEDWTFRRSRLGYEYSANPTNGRGLSLRRLEGEVATSPVPDYLAAEIDRWVRESYGEEAVGRDADVSDQYFLGLDHVAVRVYDDLGVKAAAGFAPYATSPECGGAVVLAMVGSPVVDFATVNGVFDSLVLTVPPLQLPVIAELYEGSEFTMEVPEGWDAVAPARGGAEQVFAAKHCETGTNALVTVDERAERTLQEELEASLETLERDFGEFVLLDRRPVIVPGSTEAEEITFTWVAEDGLAVYQRQLHAANDAVISTMTFTTRIDEVARYEANADLLIDSFTLTGG